MTKPLESRSRLPDEQVAMLRKLFAEQAEKGHTVFHQAHAEELLALADEVIASRSESEKPVAIALLIEARKYLDIIGDPAMVITKCDAEALAKRIDTFTGEMP